MKLISRNTDYAVRAICHMAQEKNAIVSVTELVRTLKIPHPFLRKILQTLNKKGILESHKGAGGGFILSKDPKKLYLTDIMEAFQGPFKLNECFFKKELCPNRRACFLKHKIDTIEDHMFSELKTITIASIMEGQ
ncbi:MAG: Rrf2 family transcriptional regulator [Candidatus Omnitrophota bacterium]|nr:Rrf2 family transcriptional regulator [Candidatus Omnitrophota bacterium]